MRNHENVSQPQHVKTCRLHSRTFVLTRVHSQPRSINSWDLEYISWFTLYLQQWHNEWLQEWLLRISKPWGQPGHWKLCLTFQSALFAIKSNLEKASSFNVLVARRQNTAVRPDNPQEWMPLIYASEKSCQEHDWPAHKAHCKAQNYILKIDLDPENITNPYVSRTLSCPASVTFEALHSALQVAFGWSTTHTYDFKIKDPNAESMPEWAHISCFWWPCQLASTT